MKRIILFILSIIFMTLGMTTILLNINLLIIGYSFLDFVKFIISNIYSLLLLLGVFLLFISMKGKKI